MNKKEYNYFYKKDGFTYVELLIVVGIMIIFGVFFVMAVDPVGKIKAQRDSQRESDINSVLLSVEQKIRNDRGWNCPFGPLPQDKFTAIGTRPGEYDLYSCLMPNYLSKYLVDPKEGSITGRDITDGLVGHWKFDEGEGTTAYDASGNDNHGTLVNGPIRTDGKVGGALNFDGSNDYVEVDDNSIFAGDSVTISFWFKSTMTSSGSLVWKERIGSGGSYWIRMEPESNQIRVLFRDSSNNSANITTSQIYNNGEWHYFVVTYNGSSGQIYVDNEEDGSTFDSIYSWDSDESLYIGAQWGTESFFNGQIDDVRIYNRALSPEEIQDLYNYEYSSKYAIWQNPVTKNVSLRALDSENKIVEAGASSSSRFFSYIYGSFDDSFNLQDSLNNTTISPELDTVATIRHQQGYLNSAISVDSGTTNLWPNTNGRPNSLTPGGRTPPTVQLVDMETPWGSQAYKVTIPANNDTQVYYGTRVITNSGSYNKDYSYSYYTYIKKDEDTNIEIYPTGSCALDSLSRDSKRDVGDWLFYGIENRLFSDNCPNPTGSIYNSYSVTNSASYPRVYYIAINQLERKDYSTLFASNTREPGRLSYQNPINPDSFSLSFFVRINSNKTSGFNNNQPFITINHTDGLWLGRNSQNGNLAIWYRDINNVAAWHVNPVSATINLHQYYHVVLSWDGSNLRLYLDGESVANKSNSFDKSKINPEIHLLRIGSEESLTNNRQLNGFIDELVVLPYALSEEDVIELHNYYK